MQPQNAPLGCSGEIDVQCEQFPIPLFRAVSGIGESDEFRLVDIHATSKQPSLIPLPLPIACSAAASTAILQRYSNCFLLGGAVRPTAPWTVRAEANN